MFFLPKSLNGLSCQSALLTTVVLLMLDIVEPEETCHFPQFLQSSPPDGPKRIWSTRKWWLNLRHKPIWVERQEIFVKNGLIRKHRERNMKNCGRSPRRAYKSSFGSCSEKTLVYNRTCISEEGLNTYRVIQYSADRTHSFTCMKFVKRSDNVVQIYEGPLSDSNDPELCYPDRFRLAEWPWIAPSHKVSSTCPVSGGFSFRTIRRLTNEDLCEDEWRRSSLEIECLRGDGMMFMAPIGSNCNPFLKEGDNKKLLCWAGWESEDFVFMIASEEGREPTYCLRFPKIREGEFSVLVYFSVICPSESDGKPPHGIEYYELRMHRKEPTSCRDDDHKKCQEFSRVSESCSKDRSIYPHCTKTCRLCTAMLMDDVRQRRCGFDPSLSGKWKLYDQAGEQDVIIDKQEVTMTQLATFHCLSTGTVDEHTVYKTSSLFENGCSPRYTCLQMTRKINNVLQYRIGPSYRIEPKIEDLCKFKDDPPPLGDSIRSYFMKNVILTQKLWPSYCGLDGAIPFNGTINGRQCQGTVSDWDEKKCSPRGVLILKSETCKQLILPMEFQCLGKIKDDNIPDRLLLLTRSMDGQFSFNCWMITKYFDSAEWPKRMMYQMPDAQCSLLQEVTKSKFINSEINFYLDDSAKHKDCKAEPKKSNLTYIIPNKQMADKEPPEVIEQTKPSQSLRGSANSLIWMPRRYGHPIYSLSIIIFVYIVL